ncbi:MAG: Dabb family protein [Planctomycetes bacterium]|nr:Dabb family protein [Planctomycetota bacterium]
MSLLLRRALPACTFAAILTACAGSGAVSKSPTPGIQHLVFVTLIHPKEAAAMKAESDAVIPKIPGVRAYACGPHIDVGRKNVRHDYTLGILVEFASVEDYKAFQINPEHVALVNKWKSKWARSEMFDFGAVEPSGSPLK